MNIRVLLAIVITLFANLASAAEIKPFSLDFDVSRNGKALGEATLSLQRLSQDVWVFRTHTVGTQGLASLAGVDIDERSEFRWIDGRPETLGYSFNQKMRFNAKKRSLSITPSAKQINASDDDGDYSLTYEPGLLDRNLVVLALAVDVAKEVEHVEYRVADKRKIDVNEYRIVGHEKLESARGALDTIRVERVRRQPGRETTTWIAPALGYLPVRIRQVEPDGDTLDMILR